MRDLPTLREDDRKIYKSIKADRESMMAAFRLREEISSQKRMGQVRHLHHWLKSCQNATTGLVGRALPSRSDHSLYQTIGLDKMTKGALKKLPSHKLPWIAAAGDEPLQQELLDVVRDRCEQAWTAVQDLLSLVEWEKAVENGPIQAVTLKILGMSQWLGLPESWQLWNKFVLTDKEVQKRIRDNIQKYFPKETALKDELLTFVCDQLYLSGINSAAERSESKVTDLRAELTVQSIRTCLLRAAHLRRASQLGPGDDLPIDDKAEQEKLEFNELLETRLKSPHREIVRLKLKINEDPWRVGRTVTQKRINNDNEWIAAVLRDVGVQLELFVEDFAGANEEHDASQLFGDEFSLEMQTLKSEAAMFKNITAKDVERKAIEAAKLLELTPP